MNINHLKYFLTLVKYNNFTIASEELYISQSSLSKCIKKLETELNCVLIERSTRDFKLTEAGVYLKEYATYIVENYDEMLVKINSFNHNSLNNLSIGYIPVINQYNITEYIGNFKRNFSNSNFLLQEGEHDEILNLLLNNKIDFAFLRGNTLNNSNLNITSLTTDELCLVVPKNHYLSKKKYVSLSDLRSENFISLGKKSGIYEQFLNECKKLDFIPNVVIFNSRIENILGFVSAGLGISPLMKKTISGFNKNNVDLVLLKEPIYSNLSIVHLDSKPLSSLEKEFKNYLISSTRFS